jgi:hypothetical protein
MALVHIGKSLFLDSDALVSARFTNMDQDPGAILRFKDGNSDTLSGEDARDLLRYLNGLAQEGAMAEAKPVELESPPGSESAIGAPEELPAGQPMLFLGRNKAWFHRRDGNGRQYFLAFVNAKGSCSVRTFDAEKGTFLAKHYRSGSYQEQFTSLIEGATELTVKSQPNLERDCKERLPDWVLAHLRHEALKQR